MPLRRWEGSRVLGGPQGSAAQRWGKRAACLTHVRLGCTQPLCCQKGAEWPRQVWSGQPGEGGGSAVGVLHERALVWGRWTQGREAQPQVCCVFRV